MGLAAARAELTPEDIYYLGMLHWIAENMDGTDESFRRYLALPKPAPERAQTARTISLVGAWVCASVGAAWLRTTDARNRNDVIGE